MRLKPGLIPYFLNKEKIKFTKCGVSQISFEKMRDGEEFSESVLSKFEKSCNVLRGIDFPFDVSDVKKGKNLLNYINFDHLDLEGSGLARKIAEDRFNKSEPMCKLNMHALNKIKNMDFEKISWATEVSGKDLSDKNILSSPLKAPQFAYKIENKENDWGDIRDLSGDFLSQSGDFLSPKEISLKDLLIKFHEDFSKRPKKENDFSKGSDDLISAIQNKQEAKITQDQSEFILDYLECNGYEFQYFISRGIKCETINIEKDALKKADILYKNIEDGTLEFDVKIENGKNVHQHHFYDLEPIHEQEAEFGEFDFSESQEHETYRRYVDDVEQAEVAKFYYSKFYLYIALVKAKTINLAIHQGEPRNITPNKEFHSFKYYWRENNMEKPFIKFLDGEYIPPAIPIINENDIRYFNEYEYFLDNGNKFPLTEKEISILKESSMKINVNNEFFDALGKIFYDRSAFKNYLTDLENYNRADYYDDVYMQYQTFFTVPNNPKNIEVASKARNNFYSRSSNKLKCMPKETAYFDSYLAYLANFYFFYFDKVQDYFDFLNKFIDELRMYVNYFGDGDSDNLLK